MQMFDDASSVKLVAVGEAGVGKTSLILRWIQDSFSDEVPSTIGIEFYSKIVEVEGRQMKIACWDSAGSERFRSVTKSSYYGAKGIILVYDITNQASFDNLSFWLSEVRSLVPPETVMMIIGNKCDQDHLRVVKKDVADAFARQQHLPLFETSAKDAINVDRAMEHVVKQIHQAMIDAASRGQTYGGVRRPQHQPGRLAPPGASVALSAASGSDAKAGGGGGEGGDGKGSGEEKKCCPFG